MTALMCDDSQCDHDACYQSRLDKAVESASGHRFRATKLVPGWCVTCGVRKDLHTS